MASILDLSSSSDSENDQDYVPPVYTLSSDSEPDASDNESDTETPVPKKLKFDKDEVKKDECSTSAAGKGDDEVWKSFLQDVESANPYKRSDENLSVPDQETAKVEDSTTKLNEYPNVPEKNPVKVEDMNADDAKSASAIAEAELDETKSVYMTEAPPKSPSCDKIVSAESSNIDDNPGENKSDAKKEHVNELINRGAKHVRELSSVLGAITGIEKKISVLEKSKQDWMQFKQSENIAEELEIFNKGKQGFVERQRFLERSDVRSFEMEKSARLGVKRE